MYLYEYKVKFTKYILIYCIALKDAWCVIAVNWLRSRSFAPFYDNNFDLHKRTRVLEDLAKVIRGRASRRELSSSRVKKRHREVTKWDNNKRWVRERGLNDGNVKM